MSFAILRVQKLKAAVSVRRSMKHAFREQDTPNADPERTLQNTHIGAQSVAEGMQKFNARLPDKVRKNGVLAIEYLITSSPEAMQVKNRREQDAYFSDALSWLKERHGAENVVYAGIHRDETTPHMYAYVVPLDDRGKLNCRHFLGGAKALSEMQSDFAENVGKVHGLERGIEGSKARHTTLKKYYAALARSEHKHGRLNADDLQPKVLKKGLLNDTVEEPETVAERVTEGVRHFYDPMLKEAATARLQRERADKMASLAKTKDDALRLLKPLTEGLSPEQIQELAVQAEQKRQENAVTQEAERRVKALPKLKRVHGAVRTFAEMALSALKMVSDQWQKVEWKEIEQAAMKEIHHNGWPLRHAFRVVMEHSPGQAGVSQEQIEAALKEVPDTPEQEPPAKPKAGAIPGNG